jgi:hypothetical protein
MSGRSARVTKAREPLAPRPTVGRHARRIQRRQARVAAGDFSANLASRPLDTELLALYKPLVRAHATRRSAKV